MKAWRSVEQNESRKNLCLMVLPEIGFLMKAAGRRKLQEIDSPAAAFLDKVVANVDGLHRIDLYKSGVMASVGGVGHMGLGQAPVFVSAPGVEGAVVAGFAAGIAEMVVFDDMATPGPATDADACTWCVVN